VETFLLSLHVVAAIILVGPLTVAVSLFPRYARAAQVAADHPPGNATTRNAAAAGLLHRISRAYAVVALSVPVAGVALAGRMHVLGDLWVVVSLALTVAAAVLLGVVVLPDQNRIMAVLDGAPEQATSACVPGGVGAAAPGLFALIWVVVVVLMVARPGSTTGV
jgi:hypothetical protein